jgi:hypothetical protein
LRQLIKAVEDARPEQVEEVYRKLNDHLRKYPGKKRLL